MCGVAQLGGVYHKYFSKGALIALDGELQTRNYTDKDGNKRKATELLVSSAAFTGEKHESAAKPKPTEDDYNFEDDLPF